MGATELATLVSQLRIPYKANMKIEHINEEIEDPIKNNQMGMLGLKYTITKVKGSLDGLNSRMAMTEEEACELEDRSVNILQPEQQKRLEEN